MKLLLVFLICILSHFSYSQKKFDIKMYSHARSGLSMRSTPDLKAEKDTIVTYGDEIEVISMIDTIFRVNGLIGTWYEIKYAGKTGFVFSAYLSSFPVKVRTGKHVYLKDYPYDNLIQTSGDKNFKMTEDMDESKVAIFGNVRYQCSAGGYCSLDERLYIEGMSIQEALVVFASYLMDYNDYTFKRRKFSYNKEVKSYVYTFTLEQKNSLNLDYYMEYTLNMNGTYKSMTVGFDWEGGGGTISVYKWSETMVCIEHTYSCH